MPIDYADLSGSDATSSSGQHFCSCDVCRAEDEESQLGLGGTMVSRATLHNHQRDQERRGVHSRRRVDSFENAIYRKTLDIHLPQLEELREGRRGEPPPRSRDGNLEDLVGAGLNDNVTAAHTEALKSLEELHIAVTKCINSYSPPIGRLNFARDPVAHGPYTRVPVQHLPEINTGPHALTPGTPNTNSILAHQRELRSLLDIADDISVDHPEVRRKKTAVVHAVIAALESLDHRKEIEWNTQRDESREMKRTKQHSINCDVYHLRPYHYWHPALLGVFITVLLLHLLCGLSRRASSLLLVGMSCLIKILRADGISDGSNGGLFLTELPKDLRTVVRAFDLEPRTHSYACCPQCFALYDPEACPERCDFRRTSAVPRCDAELLRTQTIMGKQKTYPIRTYIHQDMKEWIGRLFSRPGMEDLLDKPLDGGLESSGTDAHDIWDSTTLKEFLGPDGKPFFESQGDDARLAFALAVDGFNPFQNKTAKHSVTVTGMYMICLNLPPHLRYLPENMYLVGVIPGPTKPSGPEINHFLKLLVDDLLLFWEPGIRLSRTARYERGRSVLLALIPVVCDLLAAKQVTGFSGHQSTFFCTYCWLKLGDIENLERSTWPRRDFEEHLKLARAWRDAQTKEEQDQIYDERGVRWSELLRLPYWNPFQHTVIDTMHNLFLGLLHHHCRTLWGMDIKSNDSDLTSAIPTAKIPARPSQDVMQKAVSILDSNDLSGLTKLRKPVLWHLCADKGIRVASTINQLVRNLVQWRKGYDEKKDASHGGQTRTFKGPDLGGRKREAKLGKNDPQLYAATQQTLGAARDLLYCKSPIRKEDLLVFHKKILVNLCKEIAISHSGNKDPMVERLVQWRISANLPMVSSEPSTIPSSAGNETADESGVRNPGRSVEEVVAWFNHATTVTGAELQSLTVVILRVLCKQSRLKVTGNKAALITRLIDLKNTFPFAGDSTTDIPVSEKGKIGDDPAGDKGMDEGTMKKSVLGRNILSEIRKDMAKTQLPAWISPAPRNMGSTLHGKLTADQWKVACTIHLPITLIRIWGGKPEGTRLARMLANFIDLVVAVEVATMRIISEEDIEFYDTLMLRYLESMKELYKDGKVLPNHHLALHLREFLRSFGSVHAWRAFAFERYNYILQHENTNQKFGDMEGTFMRHTCRSANLRPLMQDPVVKSTVNDLVDAYDAMAAEDRRGTRVQDATARNDGGWAVTNPPPNSDLVQMEKEVYKAYGNAIQTIYPGKYVPEGYSKKTPQQEYLPRAVISCPKIFIAGVTYKPHKLSAKDSNIITRTGQAGRLEHIYRQSNGPLASEVHLVVRNLCDLSASDAEYDHYRKFPRGTGKLYYDQYVPKVTVLQPKDITCHFAKTPMDVPDIKQPCVHVLPLNIMTDAGVLPEHDERL